MNKVVELEHKAYVVPSVLNKLFVLKFAYILSADNDFALGTAVHSAENIQNGCFACTGRTDYNCKLALLNLERNAVNRIDDNLTRFVSFVNIIKFYKAHKITLFICFLQKKSLCFAY